jgi:hypothetical protein
LRISRTTFGIVAVPTYDHFIEPLLRFLVAHPEGVSARSAHDEAARALALAGADRGAQRRDLRQKRVGLFGERRLNRTPAVAEVSKQRASSTERARGRTAQV